MSDKLEAIEQSKQAVEVLKQEKKHEQAEESKEAKADAKPVAEKSAAKPAEKKVEKKEEKKKKFALERIYTIPLVKAYEKSRSHRGRIAISLLRQFVVQHAKAASLKGINIDQKVNSAIIARGSRRPPKKLRVLVQKDDEGKVLVTLAV